MTRNQAGFDVTVHAVNHAPTSFEYQAVATDYILPDCGKLFYIGHRKNTKSLSIPIVPAQKAENGQRQRRK